MSAELIARAVDTARQAAGPNEPRYVSGRRHDALDVQALQWMATAQVVDVTALYDSVFGVEFALYEETTMRPPWIDCTMAWTKNTSRGEREGTVALAHIVYVPGGEMDPSNRWEVDQDHSIDWDGVDGDDVPKWVALVTLFLAGESGGAWVVTKPVHSWAIAVHESGRPIDIHWTQLAEEWTADDASPSLVTVLKSLTFLNCRNVTLGEPARSRPERRRIARYGVTIRELVIAGNGVTVQGRLAQRGDGTIPLHTVRGHIARYGVEGRGLLFGKIAGTFWVPAHIRGSADVGEVEGDIRVAT